MSGCACCTKDMKVFKKALKTKSFDSLLQDFQKVQAEMAMARSAEGSARAIAIRNEMLKRPECPPVTSCYQCSDCKLYVKSHGEDPISPQPTFNIECKKPAGIHCKQCIEVKTTPTIEIIREHDPLDSKSLSELANMAKQSLHDDLQLARRMEEVDGPRWNNVRGSFYCICRLTSGGVRLETIDTMPHGMPQLVVTAPTVDLARAYMHQRYGRELHERMIVRDQLEAMKAAAESEFIVTQL